MAKGRVRRQKMIMTIERNYYGKNGTSGTYFKMLFQIEFNDSVDMPENLNYYFETLEDAKEKDKQYIQNKYEAILSHMKKSTDF